MVAGARRACSKLLGQANVETTAEDRPGIVPTPFSAARSGAMARGNTPVFSPLLSIRAPSLDISFLFGNNHFLYVGPLVAPTSAGCSGILCTVSREIELSPRRTREPGQRKEKRKVEDGQRRTGTKVG